MTMLESLARAYCWSNGCGATRCHQASACLADYPDDHDYKVARAVLQTLRNPDEGMLEAIGVGPDETGYAEWLFRAYFDHILNEEAGAE